MHQLFLSLWVMSILIKNVLLNEERRDIYIEKNLIASIGTNLNYNAKKIIQGDSLAVLPSLMNAHTHAAMSLFKGYADDIPLRDWLEKKIWPQEAKLSEDDVYWGAKLAILEMIKTGTTFFNDMYWQAKATARAAEEMGIRAAIAPAFIDLHDQAKAKEEKESLKNFINNTKKYSDRLIITLGPHAIYTVSKQSLKWIKELADKKKLFINIHLCETVKEVEDCLKKYKMRPIEYLDSLGFLGPNILAAHTIHLNDKEIDLLEKNNVKLIYNPASNMKLGSGIFPYNKINKKENILLGTDGSASNNNLDMFEEMKIASLLQKVNLSDPTALPANEVFQMATINTAIAFGINAGVIKEGSLADMILVDLNNISLNPDNDLISNLVYSANGYTVDTTICNGKILMEGRVVKDEKLIINKANQAAQKLFSD